jgi:hypothetical protein
VEYFRIKNWEKFQHFSDRRPIWIKLYCELLNDIQWHRLEPLSAKILIMLWMIASEDNGSLPDIEELSFRMRMPEKQVDSTITKLSHWVERSDITPISPVYHDDALEKIREEKKKSRYVVPGDIKKDVWESFEEHRRKLRKPMTDRARNLIVNECRKIGGDPNTLLEQSIRNGWQGVFPISEQRKDKSVRPDKCEFKSCTYPPEGQHGHRWLCSVHMPR